MTRLVFYISYSDLVEHGTYSTYTNKKCRCDECKAGARVYRQEMRRRKELGTGRLTKAQILRELGDPNSPRHGEGAYTNYGCRCERCGQSVRDAHKRRAENPLWFEHRRRRQRLYGLLRKYNLTEAEYDQMVEDQNNRCAICGDPPPEDSVLSVDHCHRRGRVRKLLCTSCNQGLGHFKDDPQRLRSAAVYLEEH